MNQTDATLSQQHSSRLLDVARRSIAHGLSHGESLRLDLDEFPDELRKHHASFVTLRIGVALRGCMGSVEATMPVAVDVAGNAYSAAFRDPRFSALTNDEFTRISISLSILSPMQTIEFDSEADLLQKIRPGIDGLMLRLGSRRGLLLPAVWSMLPERAQFLAQLKKKAGLSNEFWSAEIVCERFTATSIS